MLALIAGTGALPAAVLHALPQRPLVCALDGFTPEIAPDVTFRIERLGGFLNDLKARGVTQICMVGSVRRPQIYVSAFDLATLRLVPTIWRRPAQRRRRRAARLYRSAGTARISSDRCARGCT